MQCSTIFPRAGDFESQFGSEEHLSGCILSASHAGPHVTKTVDGQFVQWESDYNCGCCGPDEDDRCVIFQKIEEKDVPKKQKG